MKSSTTATPVPEVSAPTFGAVDQVDQYDEAGHLTARTYVRLGVLHGTMTAFAEDDKVVTVAPYEAGVLHGVLKIFDEAGRPVQEASYWHGVQQGLTRVFVQGHLLSEQHYLAGRLHGESKAYAESGDVTVKQFYKNGLLEGEALFLNEAALVRRAQNRKGQLEGESLDYDRDGALVQRAIYKNNLLEGPLRRYLPNGQVLEESQYLAGKPVVRPRRFDNKGTEVREEGASSTFMQRIEKLVKG